MKLTSALSLIAIVVGPSLAVAQPQYIFRRPEPKEPKSRISFSGQVLFGVTANVENLGNFGYPAPPPGLAPNTLAFLDGYVTPREGSDLTSQFGFLMNNAQVDMAGNVTSFDLTRYRSESLGTSAEADFSSGYGWEVAYDYQWGKRGDRFRLGMRAGISLNSLQFESDTVVDGRYIVQTGRFQIPGGVDVTHVPGGRYDGSPTGGTAEINPAVDLVERELVEWVWNPETQTSEARSVASQVQSSFAIDGIMVNLRVGPTIALRLTRSLDVELSAGVMGVYYNGEVTMRKNLLNLPVTEGFFEGVPNTRFERGTDGDFVYGIYGEGLLRYRATDRVSFYSSVVYMSLTDPDASALDGTDYRLSFEAPMMATAGLSLQF